MSTPVRQTPTTFRKRRGVVHSSITRLSTRRKELECKTFDPTTLDLVQLMSRKLESLELKFKVHHHALIDILDDEEDLQMEQDLLNQHDEEMSLLAARIQRLISNCSRSSNSTSCKVVFRKLTRLQTNLSTVSTEVSLLSEETNDNCLLH